MLAQLTLHASGSSGRADEEGAFCARRWGESERLSMVSEAELMFLYFRGSLVFPSWAYDFFHQLRKT